jgi:site-specific recombinase XerD
MRNIALFLNRFGEPLGDRGVQKILEKHLKTAGIEDASVHTLRHTFGTHHAAKGTSMETLKEVMGHKDNRSTSVYISMAKELVCKEIQQHTL